ncbi:MAG: hypothetical protein AAGF66_02185 [Cyanobacteria bacterium P01_H01_bin.119]
MPVYRLATAPGTPFRGLRLAVQCSLMGFWPDGVDSTLERV